MHPIIARVLLFAVAVAAPACDSGGDDTCAGGTCDGDDVSQTCDDPRYGDGTCETQLECAPPDIDCFVTFADDAAAATWFTAWEAQVAMEQGRPPRALLPPTDPRFVRTRELLDRGWDAFRTQRSVGVLGDRRPALVVIEDPVVQAFVIPDKDTQLSALTVMVQTGLLALDGSDGEMLGLMMHELQHAVGLHLVGDTGDRIRKFFVAAAGEPLGKDTPEDPTAHEAGTAWRSLGGEVGPYASEDLGGFPLGGELRQVFDAVVAQGNESNPTGCAASVAAINAVADDIAASADELDDVLTLAPDTWSRVDQAMAALRDECLAGVTATFYDVVAALTGSTPEAVRAAMSAEDQALVDGWHVMDAIWNLTDDRRHRMRDIEAQFALDTGSDWSRLRYFSTEEDADDVSVPVLRGGGFEPAALADFLFSALSSPALQARCSATIDGAGAGYGADLLDEHHAICWRVQHVRQVADGGAAGSKPARARAATRYTEPARLGLPKRLADTIAY